MLGDVVQIFMTGGGQTQPIGVDGELVPIRQPFPQLRAPVAVRINGVDARVVYAGAAPGLLHGVVQLNVQIPLGIEPSLRSTLEIEIGGAAAPLGVTLATRR